MELSASIGLSRPEMGLLLAGPVPPAAVGQLPPLNLEDAVAMTPFDTSVDFTGPDLVFALAPSSDALPVGLTLSVDGILSGTPTELVARDIVIRATNAQGTAESAFPITVVDMLLEYGVSLDGLTANPTHGPSAETGVPLSVTANDFSGAAPSSIAYQWRTVESGPIAGATNATYTPSAALFDGEQIYCVVSPDGYPAKETGRFVIRQVPPTAFGALQDDVVDLGSGEELYDVSSDFTGVALAYSVTGPGTSINAATGLLSILPDAPVSGATVTVTALNSGGTAQSAFTLTVEDAGAGPGPELNLPVLNAAEDTISISVDEDCTIYWRRDPRGTNPTATAVQGGGGHDSGSFAVVQGQTTEPVVFATGNDGLQEISFVAIGVSALPSIVQTVAIEIDTVDPVMTGSLPATGATGVETSTTPALTFSEPISPGTGSISIYDVTGAATVETFDMATHVGVGAGAVEFSGATLTIRPTVALAADRDFAVLVDPGAVTDLAGNPFAGLTGVTDLEFSTGTAAIVDTNFDASFTAALPALWASMQSNPYNATMEHRGSETWSAYPASVTDGGVVALKSGDYPQIRFKVDVDVGKTYEIDIDLPVGENNWSGPLRVKIGSAINLSDYVQIDEAQAGQPRVVEIRDQQVTTTTTELWFAVIIQTAETGPTGGLPALSKLRVREV